MSMMDMKVECPSMILFASSQRPNAAGVGGGMTTEETGRNSSQSVYLVTPVPYRAQETDCDQWHSAFSHAFLYDILG